MSCPLTWPQPSGAGCRCRLPPALPKRIAAASGSNTAARVVPWAGAFERRFKGEERKVGCSGSFLHAAFADARRANAHVLLHAVDHPAHAPQIRIPPPPPRIVRVADHIPKVRHLAAQLTLHRHSRSFNLRKKMCQIRAFLSTRPSPLYKLAYAHPVFAQFPYSYLPLAAKHDRLACFRGQHT